MSNNPQGTAHEGPLTNDQAAALLVGSMEDSKNAAPVNEPDSEIVEDEEQSSFTGIEDADDTAEVAADDDDGEEYEAAESDEDGDEAFVIEVNGEQITLDEVEKSYFRQQDYTKKTQELAAQRKAMEQEAASIAAERQHLKQMLDALSNQRAQEENIDWVKLAEEDPLEYTRQRAIYDATAAQRQAVEAERQRIAQLEQQQYQQQMVQYAQEQAERIKEVIPEFASKETAPTYKANLVKYMEGIGYSKEELNQLYDHRAVVIADKARKYDELMSKDKVAAKKVKGKAKVLRPGKPKTSKMVAQNNVQKQRAKLRKSGSPNDAVALLMGN